MTKTSRIITIALTAVMCMSVFSVSQAASTESKMRKKVGKYRIGKTFTEAIKHVEKLGDIEIRVDWKQLINAGVKPDSKLSLRGTGTKLGDILDMVLLEAQTPSNPLGWYVSGGKVHVTTQQEVIAFKTSKSGRNTTAASPRGGRSSSNNSSRSTSGMNFNFDNVNLEDVVAYFREVTKVNFHVNWTALEAQGIEKTTKVTLKLNDISPALALELLTEQISPSTEKLERIYWIIDRGIVKISTGEDFNQTMRTKTFDAANLLQVIPNFVGPRVDLGSISNSNQQGSGSSSDSSGGGGGSDPLFDEDDSERPSAKEESLTEIRERQRKAVIDTIKKSIGEDMWYPNGKGTVEFFKKNMIITQSLLGWKLMENAGR